MTRDTVGIVANPASGDAVITDRHGWIAAASGVAPVDRILLPQRLEAGVNWLPAYGSCLVEPVPGGWLVARAEHAEMLYVLVRHPAGRSAAELALDLFGDAERTVTVRG